MTSILTDIKKLLGMGEEYEHFDKDVTIHINSAFSILTQVGVGPADGFRIEDAKATWSEFIPSDNKKLELVKDYVYLKCKLIFDPPTSTSVIDSIERTIKEYEWRLQVEADN